MNHRLIEERERLGLQQKQVFDSIKVSKSTYYRWESGTPMPSDKLAELVELGFDVNYIITGKRSLSQNGEMVCFTQQNLQHALSSFLYNTSELGLLVKSADADVSSLVNMAMYSIYKEVGITYQPEASETKNKASK
ncbi:helix-turn-helix domain-containing protein [Pseudoalteromonas sp. T1lg65]|uniref:helix-turn-helix domain-containing protein n=1 Tax=Pseudoalteromonas sp. T1lg65 TaxID=2077101 RepID=UPI003F78DF4F